jgi:hypothetical protein
MTAAFSFRKNRAATVRERTARMTNSYRARLQKSRRDGMKIAQHFRGMRAKLGCIFAK